MNQDIRDRIKAAGLTHRQVAFQMGIFEHSLQRLLRRKLSEEQKGVIYKAIDELTKDGKA